jgi:hypothetical protein
MLKPLVILLLFACTLRGEQPGSERDFAREAEREKKEHEALAAQPTPAAWHPRAIWRFVITDSSGARQVLAFRVTRERTTTCTGVTFWKDIWYKLVVVQGHVPTEAAYQVEGRALFIDLGAGVCDADDVLDGVLSGAKYTGTGRGGKAHGALIRP